ncbi:hypothetical protein JCM11957_09180 [Caminibacter profundus]
MLKKLLIFLITNFLFAEITNNSFRLSYQNLKFNNENLGLLETSYFFNFDKQYLGISIYSAITGKRGGFFTGGIAGGIKFPIKQIILDNGIFIGGGGGGSAPQGSGLMLKVYSGILYPYKNYNIGFNINHIKFKDGKINSTQIGFIVDYNFKDVYFTKIPEKLYGIYGIEKISFSPFILEYLPINSQTTTGIKQKKFTIIGTEISKDYENYFTYISAGGAFKGDSDGYAEYLFGIGKRLKYINLKAAIGAGGGGRVNTKGGFIYKIETQSNFNFLNTSVGYISAPKGIKALYGKISLNKKFAFLTTGNNFLQFNLKKFNFSIYSESYLPSNTIRKTNNSKRLDVININIGQYLKKNFMIFVNAGAAYNGDSGGYAVGMFGGEFKYNNIFIRGSIGAAGGGSIDVGGGMITKIETGLKYKKFFVSFGKIKALNGKLNTAIISIGLNFDFYKGIVK